MIRGRLDWDKARHRLEEAQKALDDTAHLSAAERDRIYRERAYRLAQPILNTVQDDTVSILVFLLSATRFGLPLSDVAEVIAQPKLSPVPGAPSGVAGLIQVRGEVRPVWDLRGMLGLANNGEIAPESAHIVLVRNGSRELGILAERVEDIRAIPKDQRTPAPSKSVAGDWMTEDFTTVLHTKSLFEKFQDSRT